jgi:phospholipase C
VRGMRMMLILAGVSSVVFGLRSGGQTATAGPERATDILPPVSHVIILFQENHSFDNVLGKLCFQATWVIRQRDPCDGAVSGVLPDGMVIPLRRAADVVAPVNHNVRAQRRAIDGGRMDGFGLVAGCTVDRHYACYSQFEPWQIPNLAALAAGYVISDRTFEFETTPSWGGHMVLASATLDGFKGDNPAARQYRQPGPGWGCDSAKDALWWNGMQFVAEPSCIPDALGQGPYRPSHVPFVPTIFDRLDDAGLTWKIYGGTGGPGDGYGWTICPTFYECLGSGQRQNLVPASQVIADARNGSLPAYAVVTPTARNSQHNKDSMAMGDNWIGEVADAIMTGPQWADSAIFITYDDCGCFYDHVPPFAPDAGIRVPMVIVSPYAKPGYTDSADATYMSMLAFTERVFDLPALTEADGSAYDYRESFSLTRVRHDPVTFVRRSIPAWERAWLIRNPDDPDDPT